MVLQVAQLFVLDTATVVFELVYLYNAFVTKPGKWCIATLAYKSHGFYR